MLNTAPPPVTMQPPNADRVAFHHTITTPRAICEAIEKGAVVLTVNTRLATELNKLFSNFQRVHGRKTWEKPLIFPMSAWYSHLWQHHLNTTTATLPRLLSPYQSIVIAERIVTTLIDEANRVTINANHLANHLLTARGLLKQWHLDLHAMAFNDTEATQLLQQFCFAFDAYCASEEKCDVSQLAEHLIGDFAALWPNNHTDYILAGFDDFSPQLIATLNFLRTHHTLSLYQPQPQIAACHRITLQTTEEEIQTMLNWALTQAKNDDGVQIACIVPKLAEYRDTIERVYHTLSQKLDTKLAMTLSAACALDRYPLIQTALSILSMLDDTVDCIEVSCLLRSPFIQHATEEGAARAQWDAFLRETFNTVIANTVFMEELDTAFVRQYLPIFRKAAQTLWHACEKIQGIWQYPSQWCQFFYTQWVTIGWPGDEQPDTHAYQLLERFCDLLNEFAQLDSFLGKISHQTARSHLQALCRQTLFQSKAKAHARIHVMGVLEAAGLQFDGAWIMGFGQLDWPKSPSLNPFLPMTLQKHLQLPHATIEREIHFSETVIHRLSCCAPQVFFSHAENDSEITHPCSPLIAHMPELKNFDSERIVRIPNLYAHCVSPIELDTLDDSMPLPLGSDEVLKGGSDILKAQAACPFQAFAKYRLRARPVTTPVLGFNAMQQGLIVHHALELIWRTLKNHATLIGIETASLHALINNAIGEAIGTLKRSLSPFLQAVVIRTETKRLNDLLHTWLALEKTRTPFEVSAIEYRQETVFNGLALSLRIDRVDRLEDGRFFIIDYKTGKTALSDWFDERFSDPQMPLYALTTPNVAGIAYAKLRRLQMGYTGICEEDVGIAQVTPVSKLKRIASKENWHEQTLDWQQKLNALSDSFKQGERRVDPKDGGQTCERCDFQTLCRARSE